VTDVVRRAQAGDEAAFESLYREHVGRVYALCLRMAGSTAIARDLVQDVFVRAWERLDTYRGHAAFSSWLHRVAVNVVLMDRRLAARRAEEPLPDEERGSAAPRAASQGPPGLRLDLENAIAALPPKMREVLVLHDIEGYEHAEVAEMLGIAPGTSKAHLHQARRRLREILDR
jgi:RNA polymerase sigma-70 factor (ECF subfamily)